MLLMTSFNALPVVNVLLDAIVPLPSADVAVKDVFVEQFLPASFC